MAYMLPLMDEELETKLNNAGLYADQWNGYSEDLSIDEFPVLAHYHLPETSCHWFILGGKQIDNEWVLFGLAHITCSELGIVYLSELENTKLDIYGISRRILRDIGTMDTLGNMKKRFNII